MRNQLGRGLTRIHADQKELEGIGQRIREALCLQI